MARGRTTASLLPVVLLLGAVTATAQPVFSDSQVLLGGTLTEHRVLHLGDVDGDGALDVLWLFPRDSASVQVALGRGTGLFSSPDAYSSGLPTLGPEMVVGDLNGDGLVDTLHGAGTGQSIGALLIADGLGGLVPRTLAMPRTTGRWPMLGDADADGDLDAYLVQFGLTIFRNDGNAGMTLVEDFAGTVEQRREAFAVGDLDGDGRADLVAPAIDGDHGGLDIAWIGPRPVTGLPGIVAIDVVPSRLEAGLLLRLGDLDGDGDLDIVMHGISTVTGGPSVQVLRNEGARTFTPLPPVATFDRTAGGRADLTVADLDGDGNAEVLIGCAEEECRLIAVHRGTGLGGLEEAEFVPVLVAARRLEPVDVDCDGDLDIVGGGDDGVAVVLNRDGGFEDQVFGFIAGLDIALGDVDGDGGPDVAGIDGAGVDVARNLVCGQPDVRACTEAPPAARAGEDVLECGQPGSTVRVPLSGIRSTGPRPISRFCWETSAGTFVESGVSKHCSSSITATLELPVITGRVEATVTLTVTDNAGCSGSDTLLVATESEPVIQQARASAARVCEGELVSFVSVAADIFAPIVTHAWDFDITVDSDSDGDPTNDADATVEAVSGSLGVVSTTYPDEGLRTARVRVFGAGECFATADVAVDIVSAPRITAVSGPSFTCPNRTISFLVSQAGGTEPLLYSWDFDTAVDADGDGDPADDAQAVARNPTWTFREPGTKTVRVTVVGAGGCRDAREIPVVVLPAPEADFVVSSPVCGGAVVRFEDASVSEGRVTATWDFGDGSLPAAGLTPSHIFPMPGTYFVTETVRDENGCTATVTKPVVIADVALELAGTRVLDGQPGTSSEGNGNGFAEPGETVQLSVRALNGGKDTVTGLLARARVIQPLSGVTLLDDVATFPPIEGGDEQASLDPHLQLRVDETLPCGTAVQIEVELAGFGSDSCLRTGVVSLTVGLPALRVFSSESLVSDVGGRSEMPSAAFGGDAHAAVYTNDASGVPEVAFVRHLPDGSLLVPPTVLSRLTAPASDPRLAWSEERSEFGVAWRQDRVGAPTAVAFARLNRTGQVIGGVRLLGGFGDFAGAPDVTATSQGWVVAWPEAPLGGDRRLRVQLLGVDGSPLSEVLALGEPSGDQGHVRLASNGTTWQAAYTATDGGATTLFFDTYVVDLLQALIPLSRRTFTGVDDEAPAMTVVRGRTVLAFTEADGDIQVGLLDSGGSLLTQESAGRGSQPNLGAGPDFAVLAFASGGEIVARGVAQTGGLFGRVVPISGGLGPSEYPAVSASSDSLFLVLWQDRRPPLDTLPQLYRSLLAPVGDPNCVVAALGDLAPSPSGDGVITINDVVFLLRVAVGLEPVNANILARGDIAPGVREGNLHRVVGDGRVDVGDVVVLMQAVVGNVRIVP